MQLFIATTKFTTEGILYSYCYGNTVCQLMEDRTRQLHKSFLQHIECPSSLQVSHLFPSSHFSYAGLFVKWVDKIRNAYSSTHVKREAEPHLSDTVGLTGICHCSWNSISSSLELSDDAIGDRRGVHSEARARSVITLHLCEEGGRQIHGNEQFPRRFNGALLCRMSFAGFARTFCVVTELN